MSLRNEFLASPRTPHEFPSPSWGGVRGGGLVQIMCNGEARAYSIGASPSQLNRTIPPSLTLPHKGGGNLCGAWGEAGAATEITVGLWA